MSKLFSQENLIAVQRKFNQLADYWNGASAMKGVPVWCKPITYEQQDQAITKAEKFQKLAIRTALRGKFCPLKNALKNQGLYGFAKFGEWKCPEHGDWKNCTKHYQDSYKGYY